MSSQAIASSVLTTKFLNGYFQNTNYSPFGLVSSSSFLLLGSAIISSISIKKE
jgi:hypothetical protein